MGNAYTPRRNGQRWRDDSTPDYVLDVFHNPHFADCYTVLFTGELLVTKNQSRPRSYNNTIVQGFGTSESGHVSGWFELEAWQAADYRFHNAHRRIAWATLPLETRKLIVETATEAV